MSIKIIGGNARGRRLRTPKGRSLRPTSALVKEALFDILPRDLSGFKVLDLFAGTGNLTIEALSRGAATAILVDSSAESLRTMRKNLEGLGLNDRTEIWNLNVFRALRALARKRECFDLVFLDPPYDRHLVETTLRCVAKNNLVAESGLLIAEHSVRESIAARYTPLTLRDQRRYGKTLLSFFEISAQSNQTKERYLQYET